MSNEEAAESFSVEMDGTVALLRFDRPERRNLMDSATARGIANFVRKAPRNPDIRAIVVTGAGENFCLGGDAVRNNSLVTDNTPLDYRWLADDFQALFLALWEVELPVVSAVNGRVASVGWMLALLGDLVVAAEGARWTHVFLRRGMVPHAGDPYFMSRLIPMQRLAEIALLGDTLTSEQLERWGLVNRVVSADEVLDTALALAQRLATGPTRSIGLAKRLYRRALDSDITTAFSEERATIALVSTTEDRTEGVMSYIEGRDPKFKGR